MNPGIVSYEDLQQLSGRKQPGAVEAWARERRIPFERGADGRIWTTVEALTIHLTGGNRANRVEFTGHGQAA